MRKALKKLKGYTGRVMRDLRRHLQDIPEGSLRDRIITKLALVSQLLHQEPKGSGKIYAHLRALLAWIIATLWAAQKPRNGQHQAVNLG
jgi:hypothetical protein